MRVAVSNGRVGLVVDGRFVDAAASGDLSGEPARIFEEWDVLRALADSIQDASAHPPVDEASLELPGPLPHNVFGVGLNYGDHATESAMELPKVPLVFMKAATSVVGPSEPVVLRSDAVDWEAELVIVIGKDCVDVEPEDAWSVIAGFTVGQDLSDREVQFEAGANAQFGLGKSAPGYGPIGPWIVTADELPDDLALEIGCEVNGAQKQHSNTEHLIFDVPTLVSFLSRRARLLPGDLIFSGTPSGVGWGRSPKEYLAPGDVLTTTIGGIGTLTTRTVAP